MATHSSSDQILHMQDIFTLFSSKANEDPYPIYTRLRALAPAVKVDEVGLWVVSRYRDVAFALKRPDLFSSRRDRELDRNFRDPRLAEGFEFLSEHSITSHDPPAHTRLRKLINLAFTPRAIARLEARVRRLARELIGAMLEREQFDLIEALAVPLPVIVIAELLGVDPARRADFKRWSDDVLSGFRFGDTFDDAEISRLIHSREALVDFFREMIELRRQKPCEDLLGDLVRAEVEQEILSPDEVLAMAVILLIAGNETTTNLVGNAMAEILDHPDDFRRLRAEPALIPSFIEEALRFRSPVNMLVRTVTEDITIADVTIPKGEGVALLLASANRDGAQFPDPERFDITREQPGHVAFGYGIHFCVGASLSRLEARITFEELFRRLPDVSRQDRTLDWLGNSGLRGLRSLRLRVA